MDNTETKLVDTTVFTTSDAIQAAQNLFSKNQATFEEIKTQPWYKKLLNAIVGGAKDRKHIHRSIRDLAQLQELVMNIYITQMQSYDSDFAQVVDQLINTNAVVGKLYKACVLKIKQQPELQKLSDSDQELMYSFLGIYARENDLMTEQKERLQHYNLAISNHLGVLPPESTQNVEAFEKVENADVFYRCAVEQSAVAADKIDDNPISAVDFLNVSPRRKRAILTSVEEERSTFGVEHFWLKYQKTSLWEETASATADESKMSGNIAEEWKAVETVMAEMEKACFIPDALIWDYPDYETSGEGFLSRSVTLGFVKLELHKIYDPLSNYLNPNSTGNIAELAADAATTIIDCGFSQLRNTIHSFGKNTGLLQAAQDMEVYLNEKSFLDQIRQLFIKELRDNKYKYSLQDFSYFVELTEIESFDPECETGIKRLFEKAFGVMWFYSMDFNSTVENNFEEIQERFAESAMQIWRRTLISDVLTKIRAVYAQLN